uniref:Peptidase_M13 domain-containing protein n=1 Tax=Angiostrongylus cantonensis TaxID=6313 RepID=A0A0K0D0K2_ANGCA
MKKCIDHYSTDDTTRRMFARSWNLMSIDDLQDKFHFVDWKTYFSQVPKVAQGVIQQADFKVSVSEPKQFTKMSEAFRTFNKTHLVNYLFMRLLLGNAQYLPTYASSLKYLPASYILHSFTPFNLFFEKKIKRTSFKNWLKLNERTFQRRIVCSNKKEDLLVLGRKRSGFRFSHTADTLADTQADCAGVANTLMQFANGRVFVDYLYPDDSSKKMIRESITPIKPDSAIDSRTAGGVISNVIHSFQGMIDQLDWMSIETKKKAYDKTANIVKNIAFPDWITDNKKLDAYYYDLSFDTSKNYYDMWTNLTTLAFPLQHLFIKVSATCGGVYLWAKNRNCRESASKVLSSLKRVDEFKTAIQFNIELQYKQLTAAATDRHDFLGQPGTVNAWYQPELNSITFPAGILQPPYFHPKWPASINYGGMGLVAGHELTHGFDDEGVQWGPEGAITFPACENCTGWMDQQSTAGFNSMAHCIIDDRARLSNIVSAAQCVAVSPILLVSNPTFEFNIYISERKERISPTMEVERLPDDIYELFAHLVFQVWCERERTDDQLYKQLMVDPHSPARYRVFGTIQNYPAFRAAYNCPANSVYSPAHHCSVWVPTIEP